VNDRSALERRYRRLLGWYPADHRRVHGEEMIGVLLASAGHRQRRPGLVEALDLIKGGLRIRLKPRHYDGLDDGWRDSLAVASLAIPAMIAILYAAIFAWTGYNRASVTGTVPVAATAVLAGFLLLIVLPPVLAPRGFRRTAILAYFLPALYLGYSGAGPVVAGADGGFFLAFLISAIAFALSPGPPRAAEIMSPRTWAVVAGIGLAICVPEVMIRLPAQARPLQVAHNFVWHYTPGATLVFMVLVIAIGGAVGLIRTLPSPVGKRMLALLAVPAYPGAVTIATTGSETVGPLSLFEGVYLPTLLLACLVAALIWQSRRRAGFERTPDSPPAPGQHA